MSRCTGLYRRHAAAGARWIQRTRGSYCNEHYRAICLGGAPAATSAAEAGEWRDDGLGAGLAQQLEVLLCCADRTEQEQRVSRGLGL
jgi:hypothetical protein